MKKKKLLGFVGVDSGMLILTDPSYLSNWKDTDYDAPYKTKKGQTAYSFAGACCATDSDEEGGQLYNEIGAEMAVAFSSGYGDGVYPVYAKYNKEGRVKCVVVEMFDDGVENIKEELEQRAIRYKKWAKKFK